ncbi:MAG TPA: hypothetical protein VFX11_12950 [Candidatus Kapabacteria bacterium]|nr:hypothetical protein [Candidatus Kapabacteria bacterium]
MSTYEKLVSHLPGLYQPDAQDDTLFNRLLQEVGGNMDELRRDLTLLMQTHWFKTADKATYDPHFLRGRELAGLPRLNLQNPDDKRAIDDYPYLLDLARLGALLTIPPWREPVTLRENVEQYRQRLLRIIQIYRNGLGTLSALRAMVAAELPETATLPLPARQRSFTVEENAPFIGPLHSIQSLGLPQFELGPLMRWELANTSVRSVAPVVFIEGIAAGADTDATVRPMIERFSPTGVLENEGGLAGIGLGYSGTVAPGSVLKLQPGYGACLAGADGILLSAARTTQLGIDSWQLIPGAPTGDVQALLQTSDKMLWLACDNAGTQRLWRYDGNAWLQILATETLAPIHCLLQHQHQLLIGSDDGIAALDLFPDVANDFALTAFGNIGAQAVFAIEPRRNDTGTFYAGAANGLHELDSTGNITQTLLADTAIHAIAQSDTRLYFGGDAGVMQYQLQNQQFHYLSAEFESELDADWLPFAADALPDFTFGLPAVQSLALEPDSTLWIGSARGLARYRARHEQDLVYRNLLEAFPDLLDGAVTQIRADEHGCLWFTTAHGLLRFDGRDLARFDFVENRWQQLGQADQIYEGEDDHPRGPWRFQRTLNRWEFFDYRATQWTAFSQPPALPLQAITHLHFIDRVTAELGTLSGSDFSKTADVATSELTLHCKPDQTRIVTGGIPALPRMPQGDSVWRYLSLEPDDLVDGTDLPWWSVEGRLVPPPQHNPPYAGRFHHLDLLPYQLDRMVFSYNPAARIKFQWANQKPLRVIVRLQQRNSDDLIDPAILDRVWQGINRVRPAGVQVALAVGDTLVRGESV